MTVEKFNEAPVLDQLDGHWQKIALFLIWKLVPKGESVRITSDDIARCNAEFAPDIPFLFTHGHADSFELSVITREQAERIAAHQKVMEGRA